MNPTPHLISPDTSTPPRVGTPLLGASRYNFCSHAIHQTPQHICVLAEESLLCNAVTNPNIGQSLQYKQLVKGPGKVLWELSFANEFGRLEQGVENRIKGTNTTYFKPKPAVPFKTSKITYGKIVCDIKPHKKENHRTRLTVGGNFLPFEGNLSEPGAIVPTTKFMVNSITSTLNAKGLILDIANFYLNNKLPSPEWISMPFNIIPQEIVKEYTLENIVDEKGMIWIMIVKGMYSLKQAEIIANQELCAHLKPYSYKPVRHTPSL